MSALSSGAAPDDESSNKPQQIHIHIPPRFYLLPGTAIILGTTIGLFRGSRRASLRFLAENVHRPPTTVQGWYLYQKTKNYRVILGGLKEAGADALRLGTSAAAWVCFEEGAARLGEDVANFKEVIAGLGTSVVFSLAYRLPRKAAGRAAILGLMIGGSLRGLQWAQAQLRVNAIERAESLESAVAEGRAETLEGIQEGTEAVTGRRA
ncbi:hypothetical protein PsYK624_001930 [Phanerochaete sordida]|uniref:Uncharacterized protein n=1 Tax=Phanerochaete sordida TaxID=48140 RepID=A0A9P3L7L6_9APHY|nr:hypothetical protein PsYK624_001930 [Phanerochaete sordida]